MSPIAGAGHRHRVVVVDDHDVYRRGLVKLLRDEGIDVVGEASSGEQAVELVSRTRPDVVVMDLKMSGISGVEATSRITASMPGVAVLVLTIVVEDGEVLAAIGAGASGYLLKNASVEQIVDGIDAAARGDALVSPQVAGSLMRRLRNDPRMTPATTTPPVLTEREREVLRLVAEGIDNAGIAARLHISQNTVKSHVSSLLEKLDVDNRTQAAVQALRFGLLT